MLLWITPAMNLENMHRCTFIWKNFKAGHKDISFLKNKKRE